MRQFNEIFGTVMIEVTSTDIAMLGTDFPIVTMKGSSWAEFTAWANKAFSPNLELGDAYISGSGVTVIASIKGDFNEKSAATLKANGFTEWSLVAVDSCDEEGRPIGYALCLNIPCDYVQGV